MRGQSLRRAINDKCKDCIYDPVEDGTWLKQVENCEIPTCPLWRVRPVTQASKNGLKGHSNDLGEHI
jgi:hypothetical protein|tara:strand:+ start:470 stop:670 length:201 start_codon:yes stop_codon:yes gene_type:complete